MDDQQDEEEQLDGLPLGVKLMMYLAGFALAAFVGLIVFSFEAKPTADPDTEAEQIASQPAAASAVARPTAPNEDAAPI